MIKAKGGLEMSLTAIMLNEFQSTRRMMRDVFLAMTDGDVNYHPTAEQMAFGEQLLHVLSAWQTLEKAAQGAPWEWDQGYSLAAYPTQDLLCHLLDDLTGKSEHFWGGLEPEEWQRPQSVSWGAPEPLAGLFISFLVHEAHHRGQMVSYLRQKGLTPPPY